MHNGVAQVISMSVLLDACKKPNLQNSFVIDLQGVIFVLVIFFSSITRARSVPIVSLSIFEYSVKLFCCRNCCEAGY